MSEFERSIKMMQDEGVFDAEKASRILFMHRLSIQLMTDELKSKIREWEALDPEDAKLYSLGLRHAVDLLEAEISGSENG